MQPSLSFPLSFVLFCLLIECCVQRPFLVNFRPEFLVWKSFARHFSSSGKGRNAAQDTLYLGWAAGLMCAETLRSTLGERSGAWALQLHLPHRNCPLPLRPTNPEPTAEATLVEQSHPQPVWGEPGLCSSSWCLFILWLKNKDFLCFGGNLPLSYWLKQHWAGGLLLETNLGGSVISPVRHYCWYISYSPYTILHVVSSL